jgi:hypothetical protein
MDHNAENGERTTKERLTELTWYVGFTALFTYLVKRWT